MGGGGGGGVMCVGGESKRQWQLVDSVTAVRQGYKSRSGCGGGMDGRHNGDGEGEPWMSEHGAVARARYTHCGQHTRLPSTQHSNNASHTGTARTPTPAPHARTSQPHTRTQAPHAHTHMRSTHIRQYARDTPHPTHFAPQMPPFRQPRDWGWLTLRYRHRGWEQSAPAYPSAHEHVSGATQEPPFWQA